MRRFLLCMLSALMAIGTSAADVTPQEARQQATAFLHQRFYSHRAAGNLPELEMTQPIEGLYAFNIGDRQGFVIVSPDDRTEAVLGYSDHGYIDPDHIPYNMRQWLKGYAEQIEWIRANNLQKISPSNVARRDDTQKTPIRPLLTSHWNQDYPYYNSCPTYQNTQTLAGCVATAMAQIVNFHKWPMAIQNTIPAYTTGSTGISVPAIPAGTPIDWQNMLNDYIYEQVFNPNTGQHELNTRFNDDEAAAVADLMMFCGASINMDYSPVASGAYSTAIPYALVHYFGYDDMVTMVKRDNYTYDNWIELIYHELSEGRPVLYSGMSSSNGHQFVCDGYEGDDLFHINWGWNGTNDGVFRLSVLDAYDKDATTPNSRSFSNKQDAIIGIKIPGTEGSILNVSTSEIKLVLKSMTLDRNTVKVNTPVYATATIKNLSSQTFNGSIVLYEQNTGKGEKAQNVQLDAFEEKEVTLSYTPNTTGKHLLTLIYRKELTSNQYYYLYTEWSNIYSLELTVTETDVADGITTVDADSMPANEQIFDLQGRRVKKPAKGLYIINGKKTILK